MYLNTIVCWPFNTPTGRKSGVCIGVFALMTYYCNPLRVVSPVSHCAWSLLIVFGAIWCKTLTRKNIEMVHLNCNWMQLNSCTWITYGPVKSVYLPWCLLLLDQRVNKCILCFVALQHGFPMHLNTFDGTVVLFKLYPTFTHSSEVWVSFWKLSNRGSNSPMCLSEL